MPSVNAVRSGTIDADKHAGRNLHILQQAPPILIAFGVSFLLYGRILGRPIDLDLGCIAGAVCFCLLFVLLRLVDDLDDLRLDHAGKPAQQASIRTRLIKRICVCVGAILLLNCWRPERIIAAGLAIALTFAGPFGIKRWFPSALPLGSIVFEGTPAAYLLYVYVFWRDMSGESLSVIEIASVVGAFWTGYEFWKFSRKYNSGAMQPYFLSSGRVRVVLSALLVASAAANFGLLRLAHISLDYAVPSVIVPAIFFFLVNGSRRRPGPPRDERDPERRVPIWAGMPFICAIESTLAGALLLST
jgi:hypothetical protein